MSATTRNMEPDQAATKRRSNWRMTYADGWYTAVETGDTMLSLTSVERRIPVGDIQAALLELDTPELLVDASALAGHRQPLPARREHDPGNQQRALDQLRRPDLPGAYPRQRMVHAGRLGAPIRAVSGGQNLDPMVRRATECRRWRARPLATLDSHNTGGR